MKIKFADYLVQRLQELGITEVFGLPGDYNFKIVEAIENNKDVKWIGSTNELNAGYAADGYARIKGFGAMVSTFGVGELSAMNAIAGSMAENVPVIKIVGAPETKYIENKTLLHHNLVNADYYAFERAYSNIVETTAFLNKENAKSELDRVLEVMIRSKKPVYVAIPVDVCEVEVEDEYKKVVLKSNSDNLKCAAEKIISLIEKSKKPIVIADILTQRFAAKKALNNFLTKQLNHLQFSQSSTSLSVSQKTTFLYSGDFFFFSTKSEYPLLTTHIAVFLINTHWLSLIKNTSLYNCSEAAYLIISGKSSQAIAIATTPTSPLHANPKACS